MRKRRERIKETSREAKEKAGGGGGGKRGFLFGGSLNPVLSIPSVNSGPISIHSAGYIAEYTCFLLLFALSLSFSTGRAFSETRFKSASSISSLPRAGCTVWRRCPTCFIVDAYVYTCPVYDVAPIYVSRPRGPPLRPMYIRVPALDEEDIEDRCEAICGWRERKTCVPLHATRSTVDLSRISLFSLGRYIIGTFCIDRWIEHAGIFFCRRYSDSKFSSGLSRPDFYPTFPHQRLRNPSAQVRYESCMTHVTN